ncbi:DUF3427 domain-containing protein [Microbulbifer litoralis]|uniref:DUF3427 domain-containing protein n=1 Tax=Microbulbifer litoralis TaxID=2933965 RepID=UPI00202889AD|nr:DUF3427 domain-containing protein [Microbulbifer sp. GX H0434]
MPRDTLPKGLYDSLITQRLRQRLDASDFEPQVEDQGSHDAHRKLADALADQLSELLASWPAGANADHLRQQVRLINELLVHARDRLSQSRQVDPADLLEEAPRRLVALSEPDLQPDIPRIGLSQPWLFTAGKDSPALLHELTAELANCNQVDILVSFITVSGVRKIIDVLRRITASDALGNHQARIRVLTTTYVGATEQKALDTLAELPNCEVRVSLDGRRTRLHAKAWLFGRDSGFGSAYVGSANLSGAALMGGLEWTVKFTQSSQGALFNRARAHFESLWEDDEFQTYDPENADHQQVLRQALARESGKPGPIANPTFFELHPKPFQQDILEQLETERSHHRTRNLLVAATGTGKTVMAAFDYRSHARAEGGRPRLLFVAHRIEILQQALATYRQVLRDPGFGELLSGHHTPDSYQHLFATVQSLHSQNLINKLGHDYWRVVVIDECHHIEARQFERLVADIRPAILLGLTATPERKDGRDILRHFHNRPDGTPAVQLRLWHALDLQLLAPFEYYACDDSQDYRGVDWSKPALEQQQLNNLLTGNHARAATVINNWEQLVGDIHQCRALAFCVTVAHAAFMTEQFNRVNIPAMMVTGQTDAESRESARRRLEARDINVIVTVDLYNEGVDLPFLDTLLLLRPTQSLTVFQQQIGRGLRLFEGKENCLILDFVGLFQESFRFDVLYRSITGLSRREILDGVEKGFGKLPSGCHIQLQKQTREQVLKSLKTAVNQNWRRLKTELRTYTALHGTAELTLGHFIHDQQLELADIYTQGAGKNRGWVNLQRATGLLDQSPPAEEESYFSRRFSSLLHIDDVDQLQLLERLAERPESYKVESRQERLRLQMLAYQIDSHDRQTGTVETFLQRLAAAPNCCRELGELANCLEASAHTHYQPLPGFEDTPLKLHGRYSRREILTAVGFLTARRRKSSREGMVRLFERNTELMFVTLDKSSARHEGVAYEDYAISPELFHWQSQNSAGPETAAGRRYIEMGDGPDKPWTFQLFVQETKNHAFRACGPVTFVSYRGEKPMSITWKLTNPLPPSLYEAFSVLRGQ